eukprot:CAMPEP_0119503670 /NCGR_PEP_ID=MMETSP1344-20130328/24770_1 /TAXON_ID=236787 /ORGANISM="Florenciella parvula, Strain CCMP2471" /LENGTH=38 /DNA_ID= /DNA_START= /DNA_END= /DNA_ORIENTATION=
MTRRNRVASEPSGLSFSASSHRRRSNFSAFAATCFSLT